MTVSLSPIFNGWQGFNAGGLPLNAGQLFTYAAGTTTPQATYTTNTGLVQNANPIILGSDGRPPQEIWLTDGLSYKFQLNDNLGNPIATYDNIQSMGTLIQNFINSTSFLTQADGRYPIYAGIAGGTADAITASATTNITALYNGMIVSVDAIAQNATATPTFTLTLGATATPTFTIVDYNLQPLQSGAIGGTGHKILLGYNSVQAKWVLINPIPILASQGTTSRRQTAILGPSGLDGLPSFLPQAVTGLTLTTQNITAAETVQTANVTTPVASPGVVTWTGHTLVAYQAVSFTTSGALPTGLTVGTIYYVANPSTNTFSVSATPGASPINFTGSTSGQSVAWAGVQNPLVAAAFAGNDGIAGELNQIGSATANFTFPALTNNATNYLYSTISNLGVFTSFATTLVPVVEYAPLTTNSITAGQITINLITGSSYLGNGTSAIETALIVWGTATTSGGNIIATGLYNYGKPPVSANKLSNSFIKRTVYSTAGAFTWIRSPQTTAINVKCCGGEGGGGGGGGSAGATGNGGNGGAGGNGGTSSFGSLITSGTGGDINLASFIFSNPTRGIIASSFAGGPGGGGGNGGNGGTRNNANGHTGIGGQGAANNTNAANGLIGGDGGAGGAGGGYSEGMFDASLLYALSVTVGAGGTAGTAGAAGSGGGGGVAGGAGSVGSSGYVIVEEFN